MTLQNISRADFCDVVSVLPCRKANNGKQYIFDAVRKKLIDREKSRSPSWLFDCHRCWASNIKKAAACELIGAKKGAIFSLIYFFESICSYYIPHNYVIPQAMPHTIPQTHSPFYPHQLVVWIRQKLSKHQSYHKVKRAKRSVNLNA